MWILLGGKGTVASADPGRGGDGTVLLGMEIVFSFTFSGMVTSNQQKYGSIGVVFALMAWLIAIGVVVILGAIVGVVWRERQLSLAAPFRRIRRQRAPSPQDRHSPSATGSSGG